MNRNRFLWSVLVVFIFIFFAEWLLHGVLLKNVYIQTASLWRPHSEMPLFMGWFVFGQMLLATMFCYIFTRGYEGRGIMEGIRYGIIMALFISAPNFILYAVQPLPFSLVVTWTLACFVESLICGILVAAIYRPKAF